MTIEELNTRYPGPTYDQTILDSKWHLLWTGWKAASDNDALVAQWCAAEKDSTKVYVSSTPGTVQITEKGYHFDVCPRGWVADLKMGDFMLEEKEFLEKADKARRDAFVRLILLMERDGAFIVEEGE